MQFLTLFTLLASLLTTVALHAETHIPSPVMPAFFSQDADGDGIHLENAQISVHFRAGAVTYDFPGSHHEIRITYMAAHPPNPQGDRPLNAKLNFLIGADTSTWRTDVPAFSHVIYRAMWPGIDVAYSLTGENLKTEFRLAPGTDPNVVKWRIDSADFIAIRDRALIVSIGDDSIREAAPTVFEEDRNTGKTHPIAGAFRLLPDRTIGIVVAAYDHRNRLIFDPVIGFSTYLGGSGQSQATAIGVDSNGNIIVAGFTTSLDLAPGAITLFAPIRTTAFVAKLTAAGNQLIFCTYFGGTFNDQAFALPVDRWNNIYLAGTTSSADFPMVKPLQPARRGSQDAFIAELNPTGNAFVFSTFWGGSDVELANAIAVDRQGEIYVTGDTHSTDYPVVAPFQRSSGGGFDAFVVKLAISGSKVLWSSYLGGASDEHAAGIAVDFSNAVIVTGSTASSNFPTVNAFQSENAGSQNGFVTRIGAGGQYLTFSTYVGGSGAQVNLPEMATGVAVDNTAAIYVSGTTASPDFPVTPGAFQTSFAGGSVDAFAMKINPAGALIYSTYIGGVNADYGWAIAVDAAGNAHIAGYTDSADFPSLRNVQSTLKGSYDLFVTKLNAAGTALVYSTVLGGTMSDSAAAIALDRYGAVLVAGQTSSTDFPTTTPYQSMLAGAQSAIVARLPVGWKPVTFSALGLWSIDVLTNGGSNGVTAAVENVPSFGDPGVFPILGDWTGTGHQFFGVFRNGTWFLDINGNGIYDPGDRTFLFGQAGDIPLVGDWDGSGTLKAGLFRKGQFILDFSGFISGIPTGKPGVSFPFGQPGDIPVAGDWNKLGTSKVGVFRSGLWLLDTNGSHTINGPSHVLGQSGDQPLVGDWDGSGLTKTGVYREGVFLLDYNGNWNFDTYGDVTIAFGTVSPYGLTQY